MKRKLLLTTSLIATLLQVSCGDIGDEPAFGSGDTGDIAPSQTNVISARNFFILFTEPQLTAFDPDTGSFTESTTDIIITAADRDGAVVSNATVHVRVDWGLLSTTSCVTASNGECTITWTTSNTDFAPIDFTAPVIVTAGPPDTYHTHSHQTTVIAYTTGEEAFEDSNSNGTYDDGEIFYDLPEPYFERGTSDASWNIPELGNINTTFGIFDSILDGIINFTGWAGDTLAHDNGDSLYNGANCTHSSLCSPNTSTIIWDVSYIDLTEEP